MSGSCQGCWQLDCLSAVFHGWRNMTLHFFPHCADLLLGRQAHFLLQWPAVGMCHLIQARMATGMHDATNWTELFSGWSREHRWKWEFLYNFIGSFRHERGHDSWENMVLLYAIYTVGKNLSFLNAMYNHLWQGQLGLIKKNNMTPKLIKRMFSPWVSFFLNHCNNSLQMDMLSWTKVPFSMFKPSSVTPKNIGMPPQSQCYYSSIKV